MSSKKLDGNLTREQRVEVAQDVLKRITMREKFKVARGACLLVDGQEESKVEGDLKSTRLKTCRLCARGAFFLSSIDKFNRCRVSIGDDLDQLAIDRSRQD